jgi:transaldolase
VASAAETASRPSSAAAARAARRASTDARSDATPSAIAVAQSALAAYRGLQRSPRWQGLGTQQRLLFASTGTKDPAASPTLYVHTLAAAQTVNTLPEATLKALADAPPVHGAAPDDGAEAAHVLGAMAQAGVDTAHLAADLQRQGAAAFTASWHALMAVIASRQAALASG